MIETFGQFESRYKREGRDDWFNMHLATRRLKIETWRVLASLLTPVIERLNRWVTR
jgi:hypothetical protein